MNDYILKLFGYKEEDIPEDLQPKDKCSYIRRRINKNKYIKNISLIGFFLIPIVLLVAIVFLSNLLNDPNDVKLIQLIYIYAIMFWVFSIAQILKSSNSIHDLESALRDLENEIDLAAIDLESIEKRAEKLFKLHQYELDKYYTQNLRQGNQIFIIGFVFFMIGFLIVSGSIYLIAFKTMDKDSSIIIAGLGAIGTILSNFIAAIYIKMFSETARTSTQFHNRLVTTHNLMFSNFISSKISDKILRENTYSQIAGNLAKFTQTPEEVSEENADDSK